VIGLLKFALLATTDSPQAVAVEMWTRDSQKDQEEPGRNSVILSLSFKREPSWACKKNCEQIHRRHLGNRQEDGNSPRE
jgi:hypothetical protein